MIVLEILVGCLGFLMGAMVIALVRTLLIKAPKPVPYTPKVSQKELDTAAQKLGDMVRVPCVSKNEDEDLTEFYNYHKVLEKCFPLLHQKLEKTVFDGSLLYYWKGADPTEKPILLMGHQDVVPANDEGWSVGAFSGEVVDGNLYGRGAMDCKSTMYVEMQAVEELLAEGFVPPVDVYLEYSINEETGGRGATFAVKYLQDRNIELGMVIDEGGAIIDKAVDGMDRPYAVIGITEKGYMDVKITAQGKGGHSSTPPRNTPAARLFAFANEIERKRSFPERYPARSGGNVQPDGTFLPLPPAVGSG